MAAGSDRRNETAESGADSRVERSALLETTYAEVLDLVSRTSDFVDAVRAGTAPQPDNDAGAAYTIESMRHTTRLMQVMAWLLTQRAVDAGEMTVEEAADPKYRIGAADICLATPMPGADALPKTFREMTVRSREIYRRIKRMAELMDQPVPEHPVHTLLDRLDSADLDDDSEI